MSQETSSPSAAVLRKLATSIALDIAHAPLKSKSHERMIGLTKQFLGLEKGMMTTAEMVGQAMGHANELLKEAENWKSISEEGGTLATVMDQSMIRVSGVDGAATAVSSGSSQPSAVDVSARLA